MITQNSEYSFRNYQNNKEHSIVDGLVIEDFGAGNVPPNILPAIKQMIIDKILTAVSTRCVSGYGKGLYTYEGGGVELVDPGILMGNDLSGP